MPSQCVIVGGYSILHGSIIPLSFLLKNFLSQQSASFHKLHHQVQTILIMKRAIALDKVRVTQANPNFMFVDQMR